MALTAPQKVIVAEITRETYDTIDSLASSLNFTADQESWISDDIDLWEASRNDLDVQLEGGSGGVIYKPKNLLDEIRKRVREAFGLPSVSYEESGYSMNVGHTWIF